jgi:hypothetical protein
VSMRFLEPIDLKDRFGEDPDVDQAYEDIIASMQDTLTAMQRERRLPVIG